MAVSTKVKKHQVSTNKGGRVYLAAGRARIKKRALRKLRSSAFKGMSALIAWPAGRVGQFGSRPDLCACK